MYINVTSKNCINAIQENKFISAIEIECPEGTGKLISKSRVLNILEVSREIRYSPDDLILTYDIYYRTKTAEKKARVLLRE